MKVIVDVTNRCHPRQSKDPELETKDPSGTGPLPSYGADGSWGAKGLVA